MKSSLEKFSLFSGVLFTVIFLSTVALGLAQANWSRTDRIGLTVSIVAVIIYVGITLFMFLKILNIFISSARANILRVERHRARAAVAGRLPRAGPDLFGMLTVIALFILLLGSALPSGVSAVGGSILALLVVVTALLVSTLAYSRARLTQSRMLTSSHGSEKKAASSEGSVGVTVVDVTDKRNPTG